MRLAFITGTPSSVRLGSGTYVGIHVLRRALEALGHDVALVTPHSDRAPLGLTAWRLGFNAALAARSLPRADLVVGFDLDGFLVPVPRLGPYLVSIKGVLAEELTFERGLVRRLLQLQSWCEARNVRRAPLVLTTSRYAASRVARHYRARPSRLRVVPELIDLAVWRSLLEVPAAPDGPPTILAAAHMYARKSLDVLVRAASLLRDRWGAVKVRIAGVGPERERWETLSRSLGLADRVTFLGHVSRARLAAEYHACAIFCHPSRQEGFGIVFLEAMAAGKPIVACRSAAVPEVVLDGRTGLLVEPGDPSALADALTSLLEDHTVRRRLGEAGRCAVERYDAPSIAREFVGVCEEAMAKS